MQNNNCLGNIVTAKALGILVDRILDRNRNMRHSPKKPLLGCILDARMVLALNAVQPTFSREKYVYDWEGSSISRPQFFKRSWPCLALQIWFKWFVVLLILSTHFHDQGPTFILPSPVVTGFKCHCSNGHDAVNSSPGWRSSAWNCYPLGADKQFTLTDHIQLSDAEEDPLPPLAMCAVKGY